MSRNLKWLWPVIALLLPLAVGQAQGRYLAVQLEALASQESAAQRVEELKESGVQAYLVRAEIPGKGTFYRVRVGRFPTTADARRMGESLQRRNLAADFFVATWERPFSSEPSPMPGRSPVPAPPQSAESKAGVPNPAATRSQNPKTTPPLRSGAAIAPAESLTTARSATPPASTTLAPTRTFVRFTDQSIGYSFDHPTSWDGGVIASREATEQNINGGALFRSSSDRAFLNVIWNQLDQANNPEHDNDMIVGLILRSMSSGEGTKEMKETSRRVVSMNGQIRTYLELRARFNLAGNTSNLDFAGRAIIVRNTRGILLVVAFYSSAAPADLPVVAERILDSVTLP